MHAFGDPTKLEDADKYKAKKAEYDKTEAIFDKLTEEARSPTPGRPEAKGHAQGDQ